jgi:hypothetical protein
LRPTGRMDTKKTAVYVELVCRGCGAAFRRNARVVRDAEAAGQTRFYCSHRCANRSMLAERAAGERPPITRA